MKTNRSEKPGLRYAAVAGLIGIVCFAIGCLANFMLLRLAGGELPSLRGPFSVLPIILPLLDSILVVALVWVSRQLGWQATRKFWIIFGLAMLFCWLIGDLVPALLASRSPLWASLLRWCGPGLIGLMMVLAVASRTRWLGDMWRPIETVVQNGGMAFIAVALALSIRIGLLAYSLPHRSSSHVSRVQHVPAPAEFAALTNPFEDPQSCVVLEQAGDNVEAVQEIVRTAVPNRTDIRATELIRQVPSIVREVAERSVAGEIVAKLHEVGATASVRDTLDLFLEKVKADTATPIGRPSQVLDDEYLHSGRDAIAELRTAIRDEGQGASVDRELVTRAYLAFQTAEGRALYQINCRPCHGTKGSGDGPMSGGLTLRPANLRDPNGISMLKPGEVLWRIEQGASALPPEATPWDSSMPAWQHELDRELIWKIILGEFNTANVKPAPVNAAGHHHDHQPSVRAVDKKGKEPSWLNWPVPHEPPAERLRDPEFIQAGGYLYYYRCMPCHGVTGRGDGPAAYTMWPRPRDFTTENFEREMPQPKFKFRTTQQGWLPIDQDLYRTISRGLSGTAMEGWHDVLSPQQIWQIIAYIKKLSPAWDDPDHNAKNPYDPVIVAEFKDLGPPLIDYAAMQPPPVTPGLVAEGREVFLQQRCYECHGYQARGDGGALGQNYDDWGYRMWPQNLANPLNYKAGHAMKEIYRTFANRLDGTVMPVYSAKALDQKDPVHGEYLQWALAAYVSDQVQSNATTFQPASVVAKQLSGELPTDPSDAIWQRIPITMVPLSGQVLVPPRWAAPSVSQIAVRVAVNSSMMAVWLQWDDRRPNVVHEEPAVDFVQASEPAWGPATYAAPALQPKSPVVFNARDQLEVQFPDPSAELGSPRVRPPFFYGSDQSPVLLWRWSADRQGIKVVKRVVEIAGAKAERFECVSESSEGHDRAIDLLTARGPSQFGDPATRPLTQARADWSNGAWTLVITGSPLDLQQSLRDRRPLPVAFHVWDGLAGETGVRMAISSWIDIVIDSPRPIWQHAVAVLMGVIVLVGVFTVARLIRQAKSL